MAGRHADETALQAVMAVTSAAASTYSDSQSVSRWSGLLPLVASGLQLAPACIAANHRDVAASGLSCLTTLLGKSRPCCSLRTVLLVWGMHETLRLFADSMNAVASALPNIILCSPTPGTITHAARCHMGCVP